MEENKNPTLEELEKNEAQLVGELAQELKKTFGQLADKLRKMAKVLYLTFKEAIELAAFERKKRRTLKRLAREEEAIREKYRKQIEEVTATKTIIRKKKRRKKLLEFTIVVVISIILFHFASIQAFKERGYKAYGGEYILLFGLPIIYYLLKESARDFRELLKDIKKENKNKGAS